MHNIFWCSLPNNYGVVVLQKYQYTPFMSDYRLGQIRLKDLPLDLLLPNGRGLAFVFHFDCHRSENITSYSSSSNKTLFAFLHRGPQKMPWNYYYIHHMQISITSYIYSWIMLALGRDNFIHIYASVIPTSCKNLVVKQKCTPSCTIWSL